MMCFLFPVPLLLCIMFRAGGLSLHYQQWMAIESNQLILSWIKNGVPIPFVSKPEPFISHK